jgi:hypothetical protein
VDWAVARENRSGSVVKMQKERRAQVLVTEFRSVMGNNGAPLFGEEDLIVSDLIMGTECHALRLAKAPKVQPVIAIADPCFGENYQPEILSEISLSTLDRMNPDDFYAGHCCGLLT